MRAIGCCSASPKATQPPVRDHIEAGMRNETGQPWTPSADHFSERDVLRRVHRLAGRPPLRRPHDRAAASEFEDETGYDPDG